MQSIDESSIEAYASRTLLYFPIVHSQTDMGALSESIRKATLEKLGERVWRRKVSLVNRFWADIETVLTQIALPYEKTRIYQDGLPVCGKESDIVAELAKKGSSNHQLLIHLMGKGATIMGTESAELLIEEYHLVKSILEGKNVKGTIDNDIKQKGASELLLKKRDEFIATRIDQTLQPGETGILFLGLLHNLAVHLPEDIIILYPLNEPMPTLHKAAPRANTHPALMGSAQENKK